MLETKGQKKCNMKTDTNNNWNENTFLNHVARDLILRFGNDQTNVCVVFPNKRARLFINEEFLSLSDKPMWAPEYATIGELFEFIIGDNVCAGISANCILYYLYKELVGDKAESLDKFWGWGEIILSDFDDIDKHLVDADALFLNAKELEAMESLDFLTDNQRQALEQFFGSFTPENKTRIQERFTELWNIMPDLYHGLKKAMPNGIQPYQGALEREAVENKHLLSQLDTGRTYCFVGFNMLSETEKKLMSYLDGKGKALFYWDYDVMYKDNRDFEAGDFIRENLLRFPNALSRSGAYDNLRHKTEITFVSTSTDSIATRYIPEWLTANLSAVERETALVLCDEGQLQPVLHAIPDKEKDHGFLTPKDINITMGYPLMSTPIYSLLIALIELQTEGWDDKRKRFRLPFLKTIQYHPYIQYIEKEQWHYRVCPDDILSFVDYLDTIVMSMANRTKDEAVFDNVLLVESLYMTHKTLTQFKEMATDEKYPLQLQPTTLRRLLRRVLGGQSIPFHGEPASGLQVMGVLETRCLDFRNILMLNVGEGFLPKNSADNSLIPNTLRVGFGLTTVRHRIAVFAYYFYRLIQRAEHLTFVFNENSSGNVRHEMSRFLRQLQAETDIPIRTLRLEADQDIVPTGLEQIDKTDSIMTALHQKYNLNVNPEAYPLSPSSINRYLDCPMKFYLASVCNLKEDADPEEGIDARVMGNIFHNAAEKIYKEILSHSKDNTITRSQLSEYTKEHGKLLQPIIDEQFLLEANISEFRGENILIRGVIERYLLNLLQWDERNAPIVIEGMEKDVKMKLDISVDGSDVSILTGGRVDRMDIITESDGVRRLRIVDYKTGSHGESVNSMDNLFIRNNKHAGYYLQTFLYAIVKKNADKVSLPIKPVLFYAAHASKPDYDPTLNIGSENSRTSKGSTTPKGPVNDISLYEAEFTDNLLQVIQEIFSANTPFNKTTQFDCCKYCEFKRLCNRELNPNN